MSDDNDNQRIRKPLGLKRSVDAGEVKQTFSHGRTNKVVVEVKRRRVLGKHSADGRIERDEQAVQAVMLDGGIRGFTTKGDLEAMITKVKGMIDGESNSQQMDMLRLQSMSNKRNEAFDVMTNFVKKMQDSRSSIIGNMR